MSKKAAVEWGIVKCPECGEEISLTDDTPMTVVWIVDYDLPDTPVRRRFYRAVQRWLHERNPGEQTEWSTWSVVITDDEEFAAFVYQEAIKIGKAHLYKGVKVK